MYTLSPVEGSRTGPERRRTPGPSGPRTPYDLLLPPPLPVPHSTRAVDWLTALLYASICVYLNVLVQVLVDARWFALVDANHGVLPVPLMDVGFEWLPHLSYHPIVSLTAPILSLWTFLLLRIVTGRWFNEILRQAIVISSTNFLLRAGTLHMTLLPPSLTECMSTVIPEGSSAAALMLRPFLVLTGQYTTCTDAFFSGHAANLTVTVFLWFYWIGLAPGAHRGLRRVLTAALLLFYGFSLVMIVASQFHYTIDVVVGVAVSWGVCHAYYFLHPYYHPLR